MSLKRVVKEKGGKVIGHTKSGKPIYEAHRHSSHKEFNREDHKDASLLHAKLSEKDFDAHHPQSAYHLKKMRQMDGDVEKESLKEDRGSSYNPRAEK